MHFDAIDSAAGFRRNPQRRGARLLQGTALCAALAALASPAAAETIYWDTHPGAGLDGGDGVWDVDTTANWAANPAGLPDRTFEQGDDVNFIVADGVSNTVTVVGTVQPDSIDFDVAGYTITGGTISGGDTDGTTEIGVAGPAANITVIDSTMTGAFSLSGGGQLQLGGDASGVTGFTVGATGNLRVNAAATLGGTLTSSGIVLVDGTVNQVVTTGGSFASTGTINGNVDATGTAVTLNGTVNGNVTIAGGSLTVDAAPDPALTVNGAAGIAMTGSAANGAVTSAISGNVTADVLTLGGEAGFTSAFSTVAAAGATVNLTDLTLNAYGIYDNGAGNTLNVTNAVSIATNATLTNAGTVNATLNVNGGTLTSTGTLGGPVTINTGTATLSGTVDADVAMTGGTLNIGAGGLTITAGNDLTVAGTVANGAAVANIDNALSVDTITIQGSGANTGTVNVAAGVTIAGDSANLLSGGILNLAGTYDPTGIFTVGNGATLNVLTGGSLVAPITVASGGTLGYGGTNGNSDIIVNSGGTADFTGSGSLASLTNAGTTSVTGGTIGGADATTLTGALANTGTLTLSGGDLDVAVSALNSAGGVLTIGDGFELQIAAGTGTLTNTGASTVNLSGAGSVLDGNVQNNTGATLNSSGTITGYLANSGTANLAGAIQGADGAGDGVSNTAGGDVTVTGALTVTADYLNTGAGTTTAVSGGNMNVANLVNTDSATLSVGTPGGGGPTRTLTATSVTNSSGGTLTIHDDGAVSAPINNSATLGSTGAITGTLTNSGTANLAGTLTGAINNTGTVNLTGNLSGVTAVDNDATFNANAGSSSVASFDNDGTLTTAVGATLTSTAAIENDATITNAGTLNGGVNNNAAGTLNSTGTLGGTLTNLGTANLEGQVNGNIVNTSGTITLTDDLTVTGNVDNDATLDLSSGDLTANTLDNSSTLSIGGGQVLTVTTLLTNEATGVINSAGGSFVGNIHNDGDFNLSAGTTNLTGDFFNDSAATVDASGATTFAVTGTFTNAGTVSHVGGGALTISAMDIVLGDSSMVTGAVIFDGDVTNYGTVNFNTDTTLGGSFTTGGTTGAPLGGPGIANISAELDADGNDYTNQGQTNVTGTGSLINAGTVTNDGAVDGAGAAFDVASGGLVSAGTITNINGGTFTNAGTLTATTISNVSGSFTSTGTLNGAFSNASTATMSGTINGNVTNTGTFGAGAAGLSVNGAFDNDATLNVTSGNMGVNSLANSGNVNVAGGLVLTSSGLIQNETGGLITNNGQITGNIQNDAGATLSSSTVIAGDVTSQGTLNLTGSVTGDLNTGGGALNLTGGLTIGGVWDNDIAVALGANSIGADSVLNSGAITLAGAGTLSATNGVTNQSGGTITNGSTINANVTNEAGGAFNQSGTGTVNGNLTTAGTANLQGAITGALAVTGGETDINGATNVTGNTTVSAGADLDVLAGTLSTATFTNAGDTNVTSTISAGTITNASGGTMTNDGTLSGTVINASGGTFDQNGTITGTFQNAGAASVEGNISANAINTSTGTMDLTGLLSVGNTMANAGILNIGTGTSLTAASLSNSSSGTINLTGTGSFTAPLTNAGLVNVGSYNFGSVSNSGRIVGTGNLTFGSGLSGGGTVSVSNGTAGDLIAINGGLSGGGRFELDIDLADADGLNAPPPPATDLVRITGGATTGNYTLVFNDISAVVGPQDNDILVFDVDGGFANSLNVSTVGLENPGLKVAHVVVQNAEGDRFVADVVNPAAAGAAGNVILTQSLIGALVNRPTSPFVTGLAYEDPDPCGPGTWARALGGRANVQGGTTTEISGSDVTIPSELSATFYGVQAGGDIACFRASQGGWDFSVGAIGGLNFGSSTQPVYAIDPDDPETISGIETSRTDSTFQQFYGGLYATAARGPLAFDLQYRYEITNYTMDNKAVLGESLGLTNERYSSRAHTLSGAVTYGIPLGDQGVALVPTLGFALTQSDTGTVEFDDGSTLDVGRNMSTIGFAGVTLARTRFGDDNVSLTNQFVTGTIYNDFAPDPRSVYNDVVSGTSNLSTQNLGTYGEISAGMNYVRILNPGEWGPTKQFNASVRGDLRLSDKVRSWGITAQLRLQF